MTRTRPITPESADLIARCAACGGPAFHYPDGLVEAFTDECYDRELDRMRAAIGVATAAWRDYTPHISVMLESLHDAMRALITEEQRWAKAPSA